MLTHMGTVSSNGRYFSGLYAFFTMIPLLLTLPMVLDALAGPEGSQFAPNSSIVLAYKLVGVAIVGLIVLWYILKAMYVRAYIRTYFYDADDTFITIRKGVFSPTEIHVQYQKIQDVYVDQDILDRMLGLYDVHLASATATSGIEAHIDGVERVHADGLKNFLLSKIQSAHHERTMPMTQTNTTTTQGVTPHFDEKIASETYPIAPQWLPIRIFGTIVTWVVLGVGFYFAFLFALASNNQSASFSSGPIIAGAIPVIVVLSCISQWLWKVNFSFEFTDEYIVVRSGILSRSESHTPYRSVQDVLISQGLIDRLFGIATVTIQNAANGGLANTISLPGQPLAKAQHLSEVVRSALLSQNASKLGL